MSEVTSKRFWKNTEVIESGAGFCVALDGRPVRTPAKVALEVPTRAMAEALAREWDAQEGKVDPTKMPLTRTANAAIDKVAPQHAEVAELLAAYGDSDLLCYRATSPQELVERQERIWGPLLDWAADVLGARLVPVQGVIHVPQDAQTLKQLETQVGNMTNFQLAGFHDLVGLSGSLIIGFAAARKHLTVDALWECSRLDESWQEEQWGEDEAAATQSALKKQAFFDADTFFHLCE